MTVSRDDNNFGPFTGVPRTDRRGRTTNDDSAGGHIKTILQSIAAHITRYLRDEGPLRGSNLDDVEVYLPLTDNLKIESKRNGMTAIILANAMRSKEYPLRPNMIRSNYQLPAVVTIFSSKTDASDPSLEKGGTYSLYDIMNFVPVAMRQFNGSKLGVMRVVVSNSQISRNPVNIEFYDMIIQFNLMIYGVVDYNITTFKYYHVDVELHQFEEFDKPKGLESLRISGKAGGVYGGAGSGNPSADLSATGHSAGAQSQSVEDYKSMPLKTSDILKDEYEVRIDYQEPSFDTGLSGISFIDAREIEKNKPEQTIKITEISLVKPIDTNSEYLFEPYFGSFAAGSSDIDVLNLIVESNLKDSQALTPYLDPIVITDISSSSFSNTASKLSNDIVITDIRRSAEYTLRSDGDSQHIVTMQVLAEKSEAVFNTGGVFSYLSERGQETEKINLKTSYYEEKGGNPK